MAAGTPNFYAGAKNSSFAASASHIDWLNDTIVAILVTSSYAPDYDAHANISNLTNELAGNGYTRQTLGTKTYTKVGTGASSWYACKSAKVTFTASGGSLTARRLILAKSTGNDATSPLICEMLLDSTPSDVTSAVGIEVTPDGTNGWFYVGG